MFIAASNLPSTIGATLFSQHELRYHNNDGVLPTTAVLSAVL